MILLACESQWPSVVIFAAILGFMAFLVWISGK